MTPKMPYWPYRKELWSNWYELALMFKLLVWFSCVMKKSTVDNIIIMTILKGPEALWGGYELSLIPKMLRKVILILKFAKVIPKTSLIIPYPFNFWGSYPLSLKLFCELSLITKTPDRASVDKLTLLQKKKKIQHHSNIFHMFQKSSHCLQCDCVLYSVVGRI